jgi:hypothetical protein
VLLSNSTGTKDFILHLIVAAQEPSLKNLKMPRMSLSKDGEILIEEKEGNSVSPWIVYSA